MMKSAEKLSYINEHFRRTSAKTPPLVFIVIGQISARMIGRCFFSWPNQNSCLDFDPVILIRQIFKLTQFYLDNFIRYLCYFGLVLLMEEKRLVFWKKNISHLEFDSIVNISVVPSM